MALSLYIYIANTTPERNSDTITVRKVVALCTLIPSPPPPPSFPQSSLIPLPSCPSLVKDMYGNYVIQNVLENGGAADRSKIIESLRGRFCELAMHKIAR